ncbi:MAG: response regulator [Hyphomicrobium sp.]|nr:response regulator [Hyphomicrobium sp.]
MTNVLTGKRVLVLEDEPLIAMVLVDILEEAGCTVIGPAHDADQAAKLIAESAIDVAVLDVNLGSGHTSAPIADALRGSNTPFIFATGYGEMGLRVADRDQLRVDKPYFAPTILATVAEALKSAA